MKSKKELPRSTSYTKAKQKNYTSIANEWLYTTWDVREREIQDIATKVLNDNPGFKLMILITKKAQTEVSIHLLNWKK
ncbi:MAG: hypothetical protein ACLU4J_18830 [Butyricimonas paravirosa]